MADGNHGIGRPLQVLRTHKLHPHTPVHRFYQGLPERVTITDPATQVMTDFRRVRVVTVAPDILLPEAVSKMVHTEVRLLVVTGALDQVLGVITARDVEGERPVQVSAAERLPYEALTVAHVMTPLERLDALTMEAVSQARVGDVLLTLKENSRQHILVTDRHDGATDEIVRGMFSATQIARQLGTELSPEGPVQSFAEIERLLNRR